MYLALHIIKETDLEADKAGSAESGDIHEIFEGKTEKNDWQITNTVLEICQTLGILFNLLFALYIRFFW